jgi:hypothetical protein
MGRERHRYEEKIRDLEDKIRVRDETIDALKAARRA